MHSDDPYPAHYPEAGELQFPRVILVALVALMMFVACPVRAQSAVDDVPPAPPKPLTPAEALAADELTPELTEQALIVVKDMMPARVSDQLDRLRQSNPDQFERLLRKLLSGRIGQMLRLKLSDAESYDLQLAERQYDLRAHRLARKVRDASDQAQSAPLEEELRIALQDLFQARLRSREYELAKLETRLDTLQTTLTQQRDQKQALIDKRYDELLAAAPDQAPAVANAIPLTATIQRPAKDQPDVSDEPGKLTGEQIDQMLKIIAEHRPQLAKELTALREHDGEQFAIAINKHAPRLRQLIARRKVDPKGVDLQTREKLLQAQAIELAQQIGGAELDEAQTVREKLRTVLEKQFDARQDLLHHELTKLETRIDKARANLEAQRGDQDRFVGARFEKLTRTTAQ